MNLVRYLEKRIRGWLPKEPIASFQRITQRQMYTTAFIGVGISLALLYPLLTGLHLAGLYNNMENNSLQDLLVFVGVFFPCYMLGQYVAKLLQKKWSWS